MKRLLLIALLVWAAAFRAGAQMTDIYEQLKAHPEYLDGTDYLCPTGPAVLTKAPKGYKPFYISHYGRHGARYAWQSDLYDRLNEVLSSAAEEGNLTPLGQSYKQRFDMLYPSGEKGADLRFGHDYTFLPLLMTLNVEGFGLDVQNPDDIPYWCQLQRVPMGANIHFVFYRSKKSDKILFKVF